METINTYTKNQKKSIMKWRSTNHEQYNTYMNSYHKEYYQLHAETFRKNRNDKYKFQQECKRLRNINI